ncbi:uncharacterized protein LAESUDRAFT_732852 [Laetiporus sulphureus 93-53]|uniref:Secreted protein n=1 Tax=Laetiporus sulphureus 93-53 TaxID=1314785 RepID=A0A165AWQ8_9APHY|nr:uncharacterized protein LAESUDRAFT_732852 [Laetiporus sulphureus 93-53]KZS99800.1 hypothetical protein LAESUDRAFT_732852 [Laetiporus sulphureus 93-53]
MAHLQRIPFFPLLLLILPAKLKVPSSNVILMAHHFLAPEVPAHACNDAVVQSPRPCAYARSPYVEWHILGRIICAPIIAQCRTYLLPRISPRLISSPDYDACARELLPSVPTPNR